MLAFVDINQNNMGLFVDCLMKNELVFPEKIRADKEDYIEIIMSENNIAKSAVDDSEYVGNAIGYALKTAEDFAEHDLNPAEAGSKKTIYLFNFSVEQKHQGKGYGSSLLRDFIRTAQEKGYERLVGHFRPNGSLALIKKFNCKELKVCKNWEETNEDYVLCELDLAAVNAAEKPAF